MACALLDPLGDSGENLMATEDVQPGGDDDLRSVSRSARGRRAADQKAVVKKRAKKGEVLMLSSSYTCWRKVPEAWLQYLLESIDHYHPGTSCFLTSALGLLNRT